jgi:uroporphyrinogen decarboxylase
MKQNNILHRDDVKAALNFEGPSRPPLAMSLWHNAETIAGREKSWNQIVTEYPDDCITCAATVDFWNAPPSDPKFRWAFGNRQKPEGVPIDACPVIEDWSQLEQFLSEFPDPKKDELIKPVQQARKDNPQRYILVSLGHYFHQKFAYLRGIENLLLDFYDAADKLKIVMDRLLVFYDVLAKRLSAAGADGTWAGDDLGTQASLFMSPETFRNLYKPYYVQLADILHSRGLDFWLHTCGNITQIIPDLIEAGVDALHPIQVGTMNDRAIAETYGGKIAFWAGFDVQQILPFGTVEEVIQHVRERKKIFYRPDGGLILAAGNAIMKDTSIENIRAYARTLRENI